MNEKTRHARVHTAAVQSVAGWCISYRLSCWYHASTHIISNQCFITKTKTTKRTSFPSSSESFSATGPMRRPSTTFFLGRPRWLARITLAPLSARKWMVGQAALRRVASVTAGGESFDSGAFRSTCRNERHHHHYHECGQSAGKHTR